MIRILFIFIFLYITSTQSYAIEYTHSDGSHISISTPVGLSEVVEKTLQSTIEGILPHESRMNSLQPVPSLSPRIDIELEHIDTTTWEHQIHVKTIYRDAQTSSFLINIYEYTGGAHGSSVRMGMVIDNNSGKILSLEDFYDINTLPKRLAPIWQKQIVTRLTQALTTPLTSDEKDWIRDGTIHISDYQSFVITPTFLIVYGQQYQHNAYAYGMQTLIYPRAKLRDISKR